MDINKLNIQIGVFVRQLRSCSNQKLIEINDKTVDLLMEITRLSDKLMANAKVTPRTDNDNVNFIFDLDETHFEIRQFITCRLCADQIGISKEDLELHVQRNTTAHSPQIESASTSKIVTHPLAPPEPAFSDDAWFDVLIADELETVFEEDPNISINNNQDNSDSMSDANIFGSNVFHDNGSNAVKEAQVCVWQEHCLEQLSSEVSGYFLIRAIGIPWIASKQKIRNYFQDNHIKINGIHFIIDKTKNSHNEAFIQLATVNDYELAISKEVIFMDGIRVKVSKGFVHDLKNSLRNSVSEQRVLRITNLANCTAEDIKNYFYVVGKRGSPIPQVCLVVDEFNRSSGEAFLIFASPLDIELTLDFPLIFQNIGVKVYRSSVEQLQHYCYYDARNRAKCVQLRLKMAQDNCEMTTNNGQKSNLLLPAHPLIRIIRHCNRARNRARNRAQNLRRKVNLSKNADEDPKKIMMNPKTKGVYKNRKNDRAKSRNRDLRGLILKPDNKTDDGTVRLLKPTKMF